MVDIQDIRCALQSSDEETRRLALQSLRVVTAPEKQAVLFTAMGDENWRVRKEAVECFLCSNPDLNSVELLLDLLRNEDNAGLRNSAAEALIRLGSAYASSLIKMLEDQDADVRKFIIDVMGAIGDPVFVPSLLHSLNDLDVNVASAAAEQLGVLGDQGASENLMQSIFTRDEVLFRFSALSSLGILAKPAQIPDELKQLAEQDIFRKAVFECLGAISDESSIKLLLNGFSCIQKNSRAAALKALYKIYGRSSSDSQAKICDALQLLKDSDVVTGLMELFDSRDKALVEALLWSSAVIRDARFIPLLIEAYSDGITANTALSALKSFGDGALHKIIAGYATLDENGRSGLCILIGECEYSEFSAIIKDALHDPAAKVRKAAAITAGKLGLISLLPDLVLLVDDADPSVFASSVARLQALAMIDRTAIQSEAALFCSSAKLQCRKAAALLLASLGELDQLALLIKDEDPQVRKTAAFAIGANRLEKSGSKLLLALSDENPDVRIAVADALANLRDPSTLDSLELALNDNDVFVQSSILKAIAKIDSSRALSIISNIHTKADGLLMITIIKICEDTYNSESEIIIRNALNSSDRDIARQAARSLEHITANNSN